MFKIWCGPTLAEAEQLESLICSRNFRWSLSQGAVWHLAFLSLYLMYVVIALINSPFGLRITRACRKKMILGPFTQGTPLNVIKQSPLLIS